MYTDGSTNGDGRESSVSKSTNLNKVTTGVTIDPGKNRDLEVSAEVTLLAVDPGEEGSLDISCQTADNTASGADIQTDFDIEIKIQSSLNPSGKGRLSTSTQDESRLEVGSLKDTVNGHVKLALGSDIGTSGDVDGQSSQDVFGEDELVVTLTPGDQGLLERDVQVGVEEQPKFEGGLSLVVDDTGLAAKSTTGESGSTFSAQTSKKFNRGVGGVATEDGTEDRSHVDSDVTEDLTEETQGTGLHGLVSRVGESRARQTGEHNERRTHVALLLCCINECNRPKTSWMYIKSSEQGYTEAKDWTDRQKPPKELTIDWKEEKEKKDS